MSDAVAASLASLNQTLKELNGHLAECLELAEELFPAGGGGTQRNPQHVVLNCESCGFPLARAAKDCDGPHRPKDVSVRYYAGPADEGDAR